MMMACYLRVTEGVGLLISDCMIIFEAGLVFFLNSRCVSCWLFIDILSRFY